ncbi:TPA: hypothetical protein ACGWTM_003410 [Legionella pneumophila]
MRQLIDIEMSVSDLSCYKLSDIDVYEFNHTLYVVTTVELLSKNHDAMTTQKDIVAVVTSSTELLPVKHFTVVDNYKNEHPIYCLSKNKEIIPIVTSTEAISELRNEDKELHYDEEQGFVYQRLFKEGVNILNVEQVLPELKEQKSSQISNNISETFIESNSRLFALYNHKDKENQNEQEDENKFSV